MSEQTTRLVDRLRARLRRTMRRITLADLAAGAAFTLGALAALWLLAAAVEAGFWMESPVRAGVLGGLLFAAGVLGGYFLLIPLLRLLGVLPALSEEAAARRIGTRYPEVSDRLVNLLQLADGHRSTAPAPLVDRAVSALGRDVQPVPFEQVEDFGRARRASRLASVPVLGLLLFLLAAPDAFVDASARLLAPGTHFQRPAPFRLVVDPGAVQLVRGDSLAIAVRAAGEERPDRLTLSLNTAGEEHVETVALRADSSGAFRYTLPSVRTALRYRAEAAPVVSDWYEVAVLERPLVRGLRLTLHPPAYTGRPARQFAPNVGDVTALPGTRVELEAGLGGPDVEQALLRFADGRRDTLAVEQGAASGAFPLRRDGAYRILLTSARGVTNEDPIRYQLRTTSDAAPSVVLLAPETPAALNDARTARLQFRMSDDYGFTQLRLYYRLAERRFAPPMDAFAFIELPVEAPRRLDQALTYTWDLPETTDLDLMPGDVVEYYLKVWDNNAVAGYQAGQSATQQLRLPSLADRYERLDEEQDAVDAQFDDLLRRQEAIGEQFDALREELRRKRTPEWQDERRAEQLQQQQQEMSAGVEKLSRQIEQVTEQMRANSLVSPETQQLYQELQETVREINDPELAEALRQMQQAMQQVDPAQMQQALEQFSFNEEQYRQRLERALELFENLRAQQELEEAARRAGQLSELEQELAERTEQLRREAGRNDENADAQESADEASDEQNADEQNAGEQNAGEQNADEQNAGEQQDAGEQQASEQQQASREARREHLAREQERAAEDMEALEEQLAELRRQMEELRNAPRQEMQQLQEQIRQQQLAQRMQQNSRKMRQNQLRQAQQGQQQMQQQLRQMQQQLQSMRQGMQGQQKRLNRAALRRALSNTLLLSERQEALRRRVEGLSSENPSLRAQARTQNRLAEGLRTLSDSLQHLARQMPRMRRVVQEQAGNALRAMDQATEAMTGRSAQQSAGHQRTAMAHLNRLAMLLATLLEQMQQGQGQGSGMSSQQMAQQLQQMAGQQQQLNRQVQQFLNNVQGNRLSVNQQERLGQLARQQARLQRRLEELNQQSGTAGEDLLGDLERIAEQMQQTAGELQRRQPTERTVERQQQIRTRLLNAQRALRTQGRDRRREGQTAEDALTPTPPSELAPEAEEVDRLRRALLRALERGYAPDYEALIKRYFDLLRRQQEQDE